MSAALLFAYQGEFHYQLPLDECQIYLIQET